MKDINKINGAGYKHLIYFVAAFITFYLIQLILFNRLIAVGQFAITGGCVIYFISPLIIDVVAEVYGYSVAKKLLWCGLFSLLFSALSLYMCLRMPSPDFWLKENQAYNVALGSLPRAAIIACLMIFVGQLINAFLISKWKNLTRGRYFWLRSVGSSIIGDVTTLSLANFTIFIHRLSAEAMLVVIIPQVVVLIICSALGAIPASFLARFIAKSEGLNVYDARVNFNPFKN